MEDGRWKFSKNEVKSYNQINGFCLFVKIFEIISRDVENNSA